MHVHKGIVRRYSSINGFCWVPWANLFARERCGGTARANKFAHGTRRFESGYALTRIFHEAT